MSDPAEPAGDRIDILLATYNGERYLAEQLESIVAQTHTNWRLIVRDDGSSDGTLAILKTYKEKLGDKLVILEDGAGNLGSTGNFSALMEASTAPYVAFCDQDDVWRSTKLATGLAAIAALERQWGAETPCLSFTDLEVVDETLRSTVSSFWDHENISPDRANELSRVLLQNVVTGCTAVLNRSLVALAAPIPRDAMVHDWWVAVAAAAFGRLSPVPVATVQYRQHGRNAIGSKGYNFNVNLDRLINFVKNYGRKRHNYAAQYRQAIAFHTKFRERLDPANRSVVENFIELPHRNILKRASLMLTKRYLPTGFLRILSVIIFFNKAGTVNN